MTVVTILSVFCNGVASYVVLVKFHLATPQTQILFSLFLGDALAPAISYPLVVYANFKRFWSFGSKACYYYSIVTSIGGIASIYHLVLLSAERFLGIVYPFNYQNLMSFKNIKLALLGSWLISLVTSLLPITGWSSYNVEGIGTSCAFDLEPSTWTGRSFNVYLVCTAFLVPLIFIVYMNISFLGVVFKLVRCPCNKTGSGNEVNHNPLCQVSQDRRLANQMSVLVTMLIFCFLCSWLPYAIVAIFGIFNNLPHNNPVAISLPSFFAKSYTIYDPLVYFLMDKKLRRATKSMFCFKQTVTTNSAAANTTMHHTPNHVIKVERACEMEQLEGQQSYLTGNQSNEISYTAMLGWNDIA